MALPFNLRECASFGHDDDLSYGSSTSGASSRPSDPRSPRSLAIGPTLVAGVQAQDVDAFRELVRIMYAPLVRFSQSIVDSRDDAEDIVQDVFTVVWDLGPRWTPTGDPVAYLFASVRNHALNEIRRRDRAEHRAQRAFELDYSIDTAYDGGGASSALDAVVEAEDSVARIQRVSRVLATLSERQRTAYELRYRRGLSIVAVAEVLGTTSKAAEHLTARVARIVLERMREE